MIADIDGDYTDLNQSNIPDKIPILALRNLVVFPGVVTPILIGRESSMQLVQHAEKTGQLIAVFCQTNAEIEVPKQNDLYEYGVVARVMKLLTLPNSGMTAIVHAMGRPSLVICSPGASKTTWLPQDTDILAIGIDAPSYDLITVDKVWPELQRFCEAILK